MIAQATRSSFYVLGGTLTRDAPSYVQRRADIDLYTELKKGRFCYVLTSRQMGKSSLMVRTAVRLRQEGTKVAVIDLTALGQNLTAEQWYVGLINRIGLQLELEDELEDFWDGHASLGPLQRLFKAIRQVVLARCSGQVVMFIDEIDATRSLPFSSDEFFAAIRESYNERSEDPELERLTFCLLGVATPSDLIRDTRTTPFNIGQRIDLKDFTEDEAAVLLRGMNRPEEDARKLLRRVLHWTGGHPYLTQRLCQAVGDDGSVTDGGGVDRLCTSIFLSTTARERDDNLLFVRDRLLRSGVDLAALLTMYSGILSGKRAKDDPAHPLLTVLRLSGIVRVEDGYLQVRNRIYRCVFDKEFVRANQPIDELERQRLAERRGRIKAFKVAAPIVLVFFILAVMALSARREAVAQGIKAAENAGKAEENARQASQMAHVASINLSQAQRATSEADRQRIKAEENARRLAQMAKLAKANSVQAEQAAREAEAQKQRAELNATNAKQSEAALAERKKSTLTRADAGLDQALTVANDIYQASNKQTEMLATYVKTVDLANSFVNTVLELDPKNYRAISLKALNMYFLADAFRRQKDPEKARQHVKESVAYAGELAKDPDVRIQAVAARTYAAAVDVLWRLGDRAAAEQNARESGNMSGKIVPRIKEDDNDTFQILVLSRNVLAGAEYGLENWDRAVEEYQAEIQMEQKVFDAVRKKNDAEKAIKTVHDSLTAWDKIGEIEMKRKRYDAARRGYESSLKMAAALVKWNDDPQFKRDKEQQNHARRDLWDADRNIARVLIAQKQTRAEAVKYYRDGMEAGQALKDPTSADHKQLEKDYASIAKVERMLNHIAAAREAYTKRLEMVKERAAKEPGAEAASDLADAYDSLGDFEARRGDKTAAVTAYRSELDLLKKDTSAQQSIARVDQQLGDLESALGRSAEAKAHYTEALVLDQKYLDSMQSPKSEASEAYDAQRKKAAIYETISEIKLALGDRAGAAQDMKSSVKARQEAAKTADDLRAKKDDKDSKDRVVSAYGNLGWLQLLDNERRESMQSSQKALSLDNSQVWIRGNLADALLLTDQVDRARAIYLTNRGEEVNGDIFERAVFEDFATLRKLGITHPAMGEIEKLLGK